MLRFLRRMNNPSWLPGAPRNGPVMDKDLLSRYNSPEGAADYLQKFERHWTERVNNWNEQRLLQRLLRSASIKGLNGLALDLPCGYGRLYYILSDLGVSIVEGDWSFNLLGAARLFHAADGIHRHPRAMSGLPLLTCRLGIGRLNWFCRCVCATTPRTSGTCTVFVRDHAGQPQMVAFYLFRYGVDKKPHSRFSPAIKWQTIENGA